jgi:hypothetical protein
MSPKGSGSAQCAVNPVLRGLTRAGASNFTSGMHDGDEPYAVVEEHSECSHPTRPVFRSALPAPITPKLEYKNNSAGI